MKEMKKRTILLGLAAGVLPAMAQPKVGTVSVLPRVGVVLANLPGDNIYIAGGVGDNMTYSARYKAGLMAGVDIDWQFMPSLSATIGAQYVQQGAKYGNDGYKVQVSEGVYKGTGYSDWSTQLHYINVPLMLNAYLGTGFAVKAGVQIGFSLSGKMKYTEQQYTMTKDDVKYEKPEHVKYDLNSTLTKVTFAIPVGVSYEFSNVILDARYNIGLTQFQNIDGFESSKNRVFTFSVAYRLELYKPATSPKPEHQPNNNGKEDSSLLRHHRSRNIHTLALVVDDHRRGSAALRPRRLPHGLGEEEGRAVLRKK